MMKKATTSTFFFVVFSFLLILEFSSGTFLRQGAVPSEFAGGAAAAAAAAASGGVGSTTNNMADMFFAVNNLQNGKSVDDLVDEYLAPFLVKNPPPRLPEKDKKTPHTLRHPPIIMNDTMKDSADEDM